MPSPFVGMDPWLEEASRFRGVHQRLNTYLADELQEHLPSTYVATIDEYIYATSNSQGIYPDVVVIHQPVCEAAMTDATDASSQTIEIAEPWVITLPSDEMTVPYIEIVEAKSGDVVTAIEILSPVNKTSGAGRSNYLKKQAEMLHSQTNLVEIDLLGAGERTMPVPLDATGKPPPHRYLIGVYRATHRSRVEVYPLRLDQRLARFRIPLRHPDVVIDLQEVLDRCYDMGRYFGLIDYTIPPYVSLSVDEQAWVKTQLTAQTSETPKRE